MRVWGLKAPAWVSGAEPLARGPGADPLIARQNCSTSPAVQLATPSGASASRIAASTVCGAHESPASRSPCDAGALTPDPVGTGEAPKHPGLTAASNQKRKPASRRWAPNAAVPLRASHSCLAPTLAFGSPLSTCRNRAPPRGLGQPSRVDSQPTWQAALRTCGPASALPSSRPKDDAEERRAAFRKQEGSRMTDPLPIVVPPALLR